MFQSKKNVFWEALLATVLIFSIGLVFGLYVEGIRNDKLNSLFYESEVSLIDVLSQNMILQSKDLSCGSLKEVNLQFADRIYYEARILEQYDDSNKITESAKVIHKKYDLLRTILWMNSINIKNKCKDVNTIVYLYEYNTEDIGKKAEQVVWSKILGDLKEKKGSNIILIPIASDQGITSLDYMIVSYNITKFPVVIINEKTVIINLQSVEELEKYLK